MIEKFSNESVYAASAKPTDESRVAQITETNEIKIDGVNVLKSVPGDGDAVFEDEYGNARFVQYDTINRSLIPSGWTHVGYAFQCDGNTTRVLDKSFPSTTYKWLNVWQFSITAITDASIKFWLKCKGDYATFLPVEVALTDSSNGYINAQTATEITAVLETVGNEGYVGYSNHGYWAYLADDNGAPVVSDGTQIVVQCDYTADYRQYACSDNSYALVGCTMALSVWGDMPSSRYLRRKTGCVSTYGFLNAAKGYAYYSVNGRTPTADYSPKSENIVNLDSFNTSPYCSSLREAYGDYMTYIKANMVLDPHPKYAAFRMIDAVEMTKRYATATAVKKDGTVVRKFPALYSALSAGYGTGMFAPGTWHLTDIDDNYLEDGVMAKINEAQRRMGTTLTTNSVTRWFARRYYSSYAWFFYGNYGALNGNHVYDAYRCQAVTLIRLK